MDFIFKHPNGEKRVISIPDAEVRERLEDEARDLLMCDCEPIGETNVVECNCSDYFDEFELVLQTDQARACGVARATEWFPSPGICICRQCAGGDGGEDVATDPSGAVERLMGIFGMKP